MLCRAFFQLKSISNTPHAMVLHCCVCPCCLIARAEKLLKGPPPSKAGLCILPGMPHAPHHRQQSGGFMTCHVVRQQVVQVYVPYAIHTQSCSPTYCVPPWKALHPHCTTLPPHPQTLLIRPLGHLPRPHHWEFTACTPHAHNPPRNFIDFGNLWL
jgi:hypothetical protein